MSMNTNSRKRTLFTCTAAAIAALYVALTYASAALGLASYAIQVRFSEALCILPFFTPAAIPGCILGCFLSNLLLGALWRVPLPSARLLGRSLPYRIGQHADPPARSAFCLRT